MAPVSYSGPVIYNETDKFKKIDSRARQAGRGSVPQASRTPRTPTTAGSAMVEHYFVAAWLPGDEKKTPREFYARSSTAASTRPASIVPSATIAPGATARVRCRSTSGRRSRTSWRAREGLDLVVDYGIFT
jgi:YidC/Oxa1 family membrane protein insertase